MRIAFYAPLKSPDHDVPSGDRQMARLLIRALELAGHQVVVASRLRSYLGDGAAERWANIQSDATQEVNRLTAEWSRGAMPELWFCYHPYYKAPDLLGPVLARRHGLIQVTAEASYSIRRNEGIWRETQQQVIASVAAAAANICFTKRDRQGLAIALLDAKLSSIAPFIDTQVYAGTPAPDNNLRLVVVAMMRKGDKLDSYSMLAQSLREIADLPWTLSVIGDGPAREDIRALFAPFPAKRMEWLGAKAPEDVPGAFGAGGIYAWPGCGEAYGLAYLEAQAAGLPVVAQMTAGVPEVVSHGVTGLLTTPGDIQAYAAALRHLLVDSVDRQRMAAAARRRVFERHSLTAAAQVLKSLLQGLAK